MWKDTYFEEDRDKNGWRKSIFKKRLFLVLIYQLQNF